MSNKPFPNFIYNTLGKLLPILPLISLIINLVFEEIKYIDSFIAIFFLGCVGYFTLTLIKIYLLRETITIHQLSRFKHNSSNFALFVINSLLLMMMGSVWPKVNEMINLSIDGNLQILDFTLLNTICLFWILSYIAFTYSIKGIIVIDEVDNNESR